MPTELDVELPGGATVRTRIDGEGGGPPAVVCHGGPGLWDYTDGLAGLLVDDLTVHRWHQRGCGPSSPVPAYGLDVAVADVQALKAAWGVTQPWAVIGHSWGAYLALLTALQHPTSTAAVVYVSGTGTQAWWRAVGSAAHKVNQAARRSAEEQQRLLELDAATERSPEDELEYRRLSWTTDLASPDASTDALDEMVASPWSIRRDINRSLIPTVEEDAALLADLERCDVPFLVLHGSEDTRPSDGARELAERLPNARFHLLDGAGHLPWVEQPSELRELIVSFLT